MHRATCQILRCLMVAVAFFAGGVNAAWACGDAPGLGADGVAAAHDEVRDTLHDDGRLSAHAFEAHGIHAGHAAADHHAHHEGPSGLAGCDGCPHVHVHCCASTAMPAADCGLKLTVALGVPVPGADAPLPLGQLFYPLLRPPSAAA